MKLPTAAPSPILEPNPTGRTHLMCLACEVHWWAEVNWALDVELGPCFLCDTPGEPYVRRLINPMA